MRVWTRLTLGFAIIVILIVGFYGTRQIRQERRDLRRAAERELRLLGTAVELTVGNAFRDKQHADVARVIDVVERRDPSLDILVLDALGVITARSQGATAEAPIIQDALAEAHSSQRAAIRFDDAREPWRLVGAFPIRDAEGSVLATLVLVRPLDELQGDLWRETWTAVLSLMTLVAGLVGTGWFLVSAYVRRPLARLVQTMRAVRRGDLSARAPLVSGDEIGEAATEFNEMLAELSEARARLFAEERARETLEASLQRVDNLATVGQISAGLAHEIGSPLQILNGRARALVARADLPADVARAAEILTRESERIIHIVEQLLTFSRRTAPSRTEAHLGQPVRDVLELLEPEARRRGVRLEYACDPGLPSALSDPGQFQQLAMNLLMNALRATPRGGTVRATLTTSSCHLAGQPQPSVSLVVEDTGPGISDELLPRIFEPFFTTRPDTGGTGLGLSVVKSIVDAHQGAITVASRVGDGTRFTVHLPVAGARAGGRVA